MDKQLKLKKRTITKQLKKRTITREWEGSVFQKYAARLAWNSRSYLARLYTPEDVIIEAYLRFDTLTKTYPNVNSRHFMALFKTTLSRMLIDMRRDCAKLASELSFVDFAGAVESGYITADINGKELYSPESDTDPEMATMLSENKAQIRIMLREAPKDIRDAVGMLISTPSDIINRAADAWKHRGKKKPFGTHMLCELLGLDQRSSHHLLEEIVDFFSWIREKQEEDAEIIG